MIIIQQVKRIHLGRCSRASLRRLLEINTGPVFLKREQVIGKRWRPLSEVAASSIFDELSPSSRSRYVPPPGAPAAGEGQGRAEVSGRGSILQPPDQGWRRERAGSGAVEDFRLHLPRPLL